MMVIVSAVWSSGGRVNREEDVREEQGKDEDGDIRKRKGGFGAALTGYSNQFA